MALLRTEGIYSPSTEYGTSHSLTSLPLLGLPISYYNFFGGVNLMCVIYISQVTGGVA